MAETSASSSQPISTTPRRIGIGAYGFVYALSPLVAVKIKWAHKWEDGQLDNERRTYEALGRSPYVLPYIYGTPTAIFTLRCQTDLRFKIATPAYHYEPAVGTRWMWQLCGGAAFLESQGMAHGDLCPDNLLLDMHGNLRLSDFGCALRAGNMLPAGTEPFARRRSSHESEGGSYGKAGPATENFAIGSIYYSITRGFNPHSKEEYDGPTLIDMYVRKEFAQLTDSAEDVIIGRCWNEAYQTVGELWEVFEAMRAGQEWWIDMETDAWMDQRRGECIDWICAGGLMPCRRR